MKITKRQLRRIIKEEKAHLVNEITAERDVRQLSLNQGEVDQVLAMADAIEPMFSIFRKLHSIPQSWLDNGEYDKIDEMLLDLPEDLRQLANDMKKDGI
jgi:hypothetical protein